MKPCYANKSSLLRTPVLKSNVSTRSAAILLATSLLVISSIALVVVSNGEHSSFQTNSTLGLGHNIVKGVPLKVSGNLSRVVVSSKRGSALSTKAYLKLSRSPSYDENLN